MDRDIGPVGRQRVFTLGPKRVLLLGIELVAGAKMPIAWGHRISFWYDQCIDLTEYTLLTVSVVCGGWENGEM